ncbi:MAG: 50S ribosomal protein L11 methyltransferase, partial [Steroidobacteraceae bacterium]
GPLVELAGSLSEAVKPGGRIVLSGLLEDPASGVARAYAAHFEMKPPVAREGWVLLEGVRRGESATIGPC